MSISMNSPPAACTIAGSDSGGGAGIQADLKTFTAIGVWGTTVITAITAQNTKGVLGVSIVPEEMIALQIRAVIEDFDVRAFKTGMLGTAEVIRTVEENLPDGISLVVDPVMVATSGSRLLEEYAEEELITTLLPRAEIVTPNIPEAEILSGLNITGIEKMREAAHLIRKLGPDFVIIKGGHLKGEEVVDLLVGPGLEIVLTGPRYTYQVHGSGCCFSAALSAFLALGCPIDKAFRESREFIDRAIRTAIKSKSGNMSINPGIWRV